MAYTSKHIGSKTGFTVEFPCPDCGTNRASGTFPIRAAHGSGNIALTCTCSCGTSFSGTALVHSAGMDIEVTIDDTRVKDSELTVF
jgi:hypothetical protein